MRSEEAAWGRKGRWLFLERAPVRVEGLQTPNKSLRGCALGGGVGWVGWRSSAPGLVGPPQSCGCSGNCLIPRQGLGAGIRGRVGRLGRWSASPAQRLSSGAAEQVSELALGPDISAKPSWAAGRPGLCWLCPACTRAQTPAAAGLESKASDGTWHVF